MSEAGRFREIITVQEETNGKWLSLQNRFASVKYESGNEVENASQTKAVANVTVITRLIEIPPTHRLVWRGHILNILNVLPDHVTRETKLLCIDAGKICTRFDVIASGSLQIQGAALVG